MTTLALDLGTTFGYAFSDGRSGSHKLPSDALRYARFWQWLEQNALTCSAIAYERVTFRQKSLAAADVYGALQGLVLAFCGQHEIPVQPVLVATIKTHATGDRRADKDAMRSAALKRGWDVANADHNAVDALWLLDFVGDTSPSRNSALNAKRSDGARRPKRR